MIITETEDFVEHVYVGLKRDAEGYPPYDGEELDAELIGGSDYRLLGTPVWAHGLAPQDVVRVERWEGDGLLWITEVVQESGHWVARIVAFDGSSLASIAAKFSDAPCVASETSFGLVAVDVPGDVDPTIVMEILEDGRARGVWDFDLGVAPPAN